jgi:hypothetical protein
MSMIKGMVAAAAISAVTWPVAADAASCSLRSILGTWTVQVVETELVYPPEGGYREETSHILCELRVSTRGAPEGEARATATCSSSPYSSSAGEPPEQFVIQRRPGRCTWSMSSVLGPDYPGSALPPDPVNGTGDGGNQLQFRRDGSLFLGNGNLSLGIGGDRWPARDWLFQVSLMGMKQ